RSVAEGAGRALVPQRTGGAWARQWGATAGVGVAVDAGARTFVREPSGEPAGLAHRRQGCAGAGHAGLRLLAVETRETTGRAVRAGAADPRDGLTNGAVTPAVEAGVAAGR